MAIEFHCDHCGKLMRTSDEHAGKRGRCPFCHQSVYIPTPDDQIELLKLAPVDETAEKEQARLEQEARDLARRLALEKEKSLDVGPAKPGDLPTDILPPRFDVETLVIEYALCMANGDLAAAEEMAAEIRKNTMAAEQVIQRLLLDEVPPTQLASIPRPVLVGFFKQLREAG